MGAFQMVASGAERNAAKAGRLTRLRMKVSHSDNYIGESVLPWSALNVAWDSVPHAAPYTGPWRHALSY